MLEEMFVKFMSAIQSAGEVLLLEPSTEGHAQHVVLAICRQPPDRVKKISEMPRTPAYLMKLYNNPTCDVNETCHGEPHLAPSGDATQDIAS